ncbi:MAG: 4Fe-4S ferredoxin, partial [Planctomycetota bacterium]
AALDPAQAPPAEDYLWSAGGNGVSAVDLIRARREAQENADARRVYDARRKPAPWGWMVSTYVTTKAISAGVVMVTFLLYLFGDAPAALPLPPALVSLAALAVTGALLVADLKQPQRFLYVLLRPQWRSWLVRGAYLITAFGVLALVTALLSLADAGAGVQLVFGGLVAAFGVPVAAYTALLFAQARGRDYWQSPLLSITMLFDALAAGAAVAALLGSFGVAGGIHCDPARYGLAVCAVLLGGLLAAEFLTPHPTKNASRAAQVIVRGEFSRWFWIGVVLIGVLAPLVVALATKDVIIASLGLLAGIAIKNHLLVQAPQRVPLS